MPFPRRQCGEAHASAGVREMSEEESFLPTEWNKDATCFRIDFASHVGA